MQRQLRWKSFSISKHQERAGWDDGHRSHVWMLNMHLEPTEDWGEHFTWPQILMRLLLLFLLLDSERKDESMCSTCHHLLTTYYCMHAEIIRAVSEFWGALTTCRQGIELIGWGFQAMSKLEVMWRLAGLCWDQQSQQLYNYTGKWWRTERQCSQDVYQEKG